MNKSPQATTSFIHKPCIVERLALEKIFPSPQPLHVELGSGDGNWLNQYAALHPEYNFIGIERLLGRLRKIDRKAQRAGLSNVCLIRLEATYVLEFLLPKKQAAAIHVYFPDPWPKRKHRKNRLINTRFTELACQALKPNGIVYLRTDDTDYFAQMSEVFDANPNFKKIETPKELTTVITDFERNFLTRGIPARHVAYQIKG